jgi:hypothetical protein
MASFSNSQAIDQLEAGRAIESWLGHADFPTYRTIKWLKISREKSGLFAVSAFEVFDDGSPELLDIYDFEPIDPDLVAGSSIEVANAKDAILEAVKMGAQENGFVGDGVIQDVYARFLMEHGLANSN